MNVNSIKQYLLKGANAVSAGADGRELLMEKAEEEFELKDYSNSIFYQVRAVFETVQERLYQINQQNTETVKAQHKSNRQRLSEIKENFNEYETLNMDKNPLIKTAFEELAAADEGAIIDSEVVTSNFLQNIENPKDGFQVISEMCQKLPKEWTVIQLSKGTHIKTTNSTYPTIIVQPASIYISILRHARSNEFPHPICCRIFKPTQQSVAFSIQGTIADQFKKCISINHEEYDTKYKRAEYWDVLLEFDEHMKDAIEKMKKLIHPWEFLFFGQPHNTKDLSNYKNVAFAEVDKLCKLLKCTKSAEHELLSLAALHVSHLSDVDMMNICQSLFVDNTQLHQAYKLLYKLKLIAPELNALLGDMRILPNYPCVLIVDERLDHFFWEEMCVYQEYTRISSLQCLLRLYEAYADRIKHGYFQVNINRGACLVNPDQSLPSTEMLIKSFMKYYLPEWKIIASQEPTEKDFTEDIFKRDCYLYAGHGSGLQYTTGKTISKYNTGCVALIFGCDSTRLLSQGLHSELIGAHLYFQAALCPTYMGALMPALDRATDDLAAEIFSRWIIEPSKDKIHWTKVNHSSWFREGIIKEATKLGNPYSDNLKNLGSLSAVMAKVHQRVNKKHLFQTAQFICRGLPAWNTNFPMDF